MNDSFSTIGHPRRWVPVSVMGIAVALGSASANAMNIVPFYDSSITTNANSIAIQQDINSAIAVYNSVFTDNITVNLTFHNTTSGLGSNNPTTIDVDYQTLRTALGNDA